MVENIYIFIFTFIFALPNSSVFHATKVPTLSLMLSLLSLHKSRRLAVPASSHVGNDRV